MSQPTAPGALSGPAARSVGLYVHVPFCERVCPYCDFAVVAARPLEPEREQRYVDALLRELGARAEGWSGRSLASLYFGGGTPALLRSGSIGRVIEAARARFPAARDPEITLEANPSTLERRRLAAFRDVGVNRLSLGVQSFDDTVLRRLGRAHKAEEAHETVAAARAAGFENLSLDLIYAAPGGSRPQLASDLAALLAHGPEHISAYELTIEEDTPFGTAVERGQLVRPDDDETAAMSVSIESALSAAGYTRYEVSSYARPGREARHNRRYWRREPVLGLGMGAWSTRPASPDAPYGAREANPRELEQWLAAVDAGGASVEAREVFDAATARGEAAFLGLRELRAGLLAAPFEAEFGGAPRAFFAPQIDELLGQGLLTEGTNGDLRLTPRGRLFADSVAERFV